MSLSAYRLMWMMVMFDLPTVTKSDQNAANRFRNFLLDEGFEMSQFSVYMRFCAGTPQVEARIGRIRSNLPKRGKVQILTFTDRQYQTMVCFDTRTKQEPAAKYEQFKLF
ncbi:CRISPR-associated protein, Cas2 family [Azospirillum oryzae]|uniref:CRISPR-associated endoribonuclease Cas2 n=2 Tax=Azospirillum oryzae TaxID=286727 RepID=A0A1X7GP95_9PROT|nr:CRISPR-associated protein, Cas2 family [Azospirillum oryzae]